MEKVIKVTKVKAHFSQVLSLGIKVSILKWEILGVMFVKSKYFDYPSFLSFLFDLYELFFFNAMTTTPLSIWQDYNFSTYFKLHENRIQKCHTASRSIFLDQNRLLYIINDTPRCFYNDSRNQGLTF